MYVYMYEIHVTEKLYMYNIHVVVFVHVCVHV